MQLPTQTNPLSFKKGMTLNQYLSQMRTNDTNPTATENPQFLEEDLYQTSRIGNQKFSNKLITYQIRQSDEDNYDQQSGITDTQANQLKGKSVIASTQRSSNKNILNINAEFQKKQMLRNSKGFRVRNQSNSPYHIKKKQFSPTINKTLVKSLYNNQWKQYKQSRPNLPNAPQGATLYGNFFKGITQKTNQKHFKKKNNRQIDNILKYERQKSYKYGDLARNQFKIEGISDKLHHRNNKFIK